MSQLNCWSCGTAYDVPPGESVPFRASCDQCSAFLHCCVGCRYYRPGKPNDCLVPGTERVLDRERYNFCEEFKPSDKVQDKPTRSAEDAFKDLFGD